MSFREDIEGVYKNTHSKIAPVGIYTRYLPRGFRERSARNIGLGIIEYFPVVTFPGPPWHMKDGYLSEVKDISFSERYMFEKGKIIRRRMYETKYGTLTQEVEKDKAGAGSEHIRSHWVKSSTDYRIMSYIIKNSILRQNFEVIKQMQEDLGEDGVVIGRMDRSPYQKCLIELAGPEKFLVDLHTDPDPVKELLDVLGEKLCEAYQFAAESDIDIIWQPDNVTADMTPPNFFREYIYPLYKQFSKLMHSAEKKLLVHMDGKIKPLLSLINESGIDAVESFSLPDIGGDVSIAEASKRLSRAVLIPSVPSNWTVFSDEEIRRRVIEVIQSRDMDKPFMLQFSEDIPHQEWKRVVRTVVTTVSELREKE